MKSAANYVTYNKYYFTTDQNKINKFLESLVEDKNCSEIVNRADKELVELTPSQMERIRIVTDIIQKHVIKEEPH